MQYNVYTKLPEVYSKAVLATPMQVDKFVAVQVELQLGSLFTVTMKQNTKWLRNS